jgi:hypothetical protein
VGAAWTGGPGRASMSPLSGMSDGSGHWLAELQPLQPGSLVLLHDRLAG